MPVAPPLPAGAVTMEVKTWVEGGGDAAVATEVVTALPVVLGSGLSVLEVAGRVVWGVVLGEVAVARRLG